MAESLARHWPVIMKNARTVIGADHFDTWFGSLRLESWLDNHVTLSVDSHASKDWLEEHYLDLIHELCRRETEADATVSIVVRKGKRNGAASAQAHAAPGNGAVNGHASSHGGAASSTNAFPTTELDPRFYFESFVRGPSNELAYTAALTVAEHPAQVFNPVFLYGGSGLGKTHLMHAIGHRVRQLFPRKVVTYVPAMDFVNGYIEATVNRSWTDFHARFRNVDVLLIDDVHFLAGKEGSQEQFFHTFNSLQMSSKQIVISSDRPPRDLPTFENRLRSRFEGGLMADISPPELETRVAILREKSKRLDLRLNDDVTYFIADRIRYNVRDLEGALIRLTAFAAIYNLAAITVDAAASVLADLLPRDANTVTLDKIVDVVAKHFRVKVSELLGHKRTRTLTVPRQVAMYIARQLTDHSYPEIAAYFGNRDHSTVIHACRRIESEMETNNDMRLKINALMAQLRLD